MHKIWTKRCYLPRRIELHSWLLIDAIILYRKQWIRCCYYQSWKIMATLSSVHISHFSCEFDARRWFFAQRVMSLKYSDWLAIDLEFMPVYCPIFRELGNKWAKSSGNCISKLLPHRAAAFFCHTPTSCISIWERSMRDEPRNTVRFGS